MKRIKLGASKNRTIFGLTLQGSLIALAGIAVVVMIIIIIVSSVKNTDNEVTDTVSAEVITTADFERLDD